MLTVVLVLAPPMLHLGVVQIQGATPEITRLRVPLTLVTTLIVALLTILRQVGHLRRVESRVAAREAERDAAEKARVQVEERYRGLVQSVSAVVWRADPSTFRFTFVSDQAEALLGYPVAAWTDEPDFWLRHLHPEDRVVRREDAAARRSPRAGATSSDTGWSPRPETRCGSATACASSPTRAAAPRSWAS